MKADNDASGSTRSLLSRALVYLNWYVREVARACAVHIGVTTVLAVLGLIGAGLYYIYPGGATQQRPAGKTEHPPITDGWSVKVKPAPR